MSQVESKSTFTEGEWTFDPENVGITRTDGYGLLCDGRSLGVTVHCEYPNAEANARLLAASLRMFECLQDGGVSGNGGETKHLFSETLNKIADFLEHNAIVAQDDALDFAAWLRGKSSDIEVVIAKATGG